MAHDGRRCQEPALVRLTSPRVAAATHRLMSDRREGHGMTGRRVRTWAARRVQKDVTDRLLQGLPNPSRYRLRKFAEQAAAQAARRPSSVGRRRGKGAVSQAVRPLDV
jgi:hypothetical protein